jgi:hypothetical protein
MGPPETAHVASGAARRPIGQGRIESWQDVRALAPSGYRIRRASGGDGGQC